MKGTFMALALFLLAAGVYAAGGAYLDDFRIANNGLTIFSDNFDDGKLDGWTKVHNVTVTCDKPGKPPCGMYINKHTYAAATAYHNLTLNNAGVIEFRAKVYLTPPEEQYEWRVKNRPAVIQITLYSGSSNATMRTSVHLDPCQQQAKACITTDRLGSGRCPKYNPLPKNTWGDLVLTMDPKTRMATTSLDGQQEISIPYNPAEWRSVREVGICASYGDGSQRTDR